MGIWTFYFLAKLYLHYRGYVRLDVLLNLLFLAFIVFPLPKRFGESTLALMAKQALAMIIAVLLIWRESWLPDPLHAITMLQQNGMPSREYLYQFFLRLLVPKELAVFTVIAVLSFLVRKYRRSAATGMAVLLLIPLVFVTGEHGRRSPDEVDAHVRSFFNAESMRVIRPVPPQATSRDFDILILHICSLAWDDLRELGMQDHPFFKQFDFLFTNFNTVTTYSNPAAIRLLNGNCGQRRHADLYNTLPGDCSLMKGLGHQGYAIRFSRNHNGTYGKFDQELRQLGHLDAAPFAPSNLEARKYMFDDTPVYADYDVLEQWWKNRLRSSEKKVALYYNSVSLHDGSHWTDDREWWKRDNREQYREFLQSLLDDLSRFMGTLAASGRDVLVIVAGEHGRAVRGNAIETPGLRDIPLPRITIVPVGLKLISKDRRTGAAGRNMIIDKPSSYLSLAFTIEAFAGQSPFVTDRYATRAFIDSIPQTSFAAENQNNLVVKMDDEYYFYGKERKWIYLSREALK
ncbi:MAG: cellulose biosynthesis protein BcsG [Nitrospirota bacterium]|nr:cellulose biosynthesis protein BcsG [Nitrospirota bacterium]